MSGAPSTQEDPLTTGTLTLARPAAATTAIFALPIGLSAFLLFSVEPLIGRLVLPVFGGTPAVWATVLFFFQTILLIGYAYGHLSVTRLGLVGPPLHLVLAGLALLSLLVGPTVVADLRDPAVVPVVDLIRILLVIIGLPALVLTTTTPLVSGWFESVRDRDGGGDPYWLYALSNAGSLAALLAYPLLIEPALGLAQQRSIWMVGYGVLIALLALSASRVVPVIRARTATAAAAHTAALDTASVTVVEDTEITWARRGRWLLLAAIPSGLLSAVTTFIATDLVSAPLLWVLPLAIYLGTFIIAFSPRASTPIRLAVLAAPAMVTLLWVPYGSAGGWPVVLILPMELIAFGVTATALHGLLAADRPSPSHLTEFYLVMSLGGALASAFVALVAPNVFPGVWEYPLLLVGALVALALVVPAPATKPKTGRGLDFSPFFAGAVGRMVPYLLVAVPMGLILVASGSIAAEAGLRWLLVGGLVLLVGAKPWFLATATAVVLLLATFVLQPAVEFRARSFFGVTEVMPSPDGQLTLLMNGTTVHGSQSTDPARRRTPQSYYVQAGPVGDIFRILASERTGGREVAITGLGGGAIATYADEGTDMTFYEIDPVVIDVASDPQYFTYLSDAPTTPTIVEGDARLSLRDVPDGTYDLLLMDAFSSDSPPVHLLTTEAVADEVRVTKPDGLVVFHVSNRYYDLTPPVAAAARAAGLTVLGKSHQPGDIREPGETPSKWLAASSNPETLAALREAGWSEVKLSDHPFTDDYADLLRYLDLGL